MNVVMSLLPASVSNALIERPFLLFKNRLSTPAAGALRTESPEASPALE